MTGLSRRDALRAVGASGVGLTAATMSTGHAAAAAPRVASDPPAKAFILIGSEIRAVGPRRNAGDQAVITGAIRLSTDDRPSGEFFGQSTVVNRRNLLTDTTGTMQTHTFVLPDGTLIGSGVLSHHGAGTFAIIGGTGSYQGLSGSYAVDQDLDDFAATATYTFALLPGKAQT
jgi:hypothetical protein